MRGGKKLGFFIPGGASSPWLLEEHLDAPLDMDYVQSELSATTMLGSGALMVYDETVDPLLVAWRIAKFFAHESCGKCTPCREGSGWLEKVLYRMLHGYGRPEDLDLMLGFGNNLAPGLGWPPGHDNDLPARSEHDVAGREPQPFLARRDHRAHVRRHRPPQLAEGDCSRMTTNAVPMSHSGRRTIAT